VDNSILWPIRHTVLLAGHEFEFFRAVANGGKRIPGATPQPQGFRPEVVGPRRERTGESLVLGRGSVQPHGL